LPINKYGFLGKEIKVYQCKVLKKYKEVFDFYEKLNYFMNQIKFKINLKNDDFQGGTMLGIFCKTLTTFQSIYILFKNYLCNNAEELCRILFEEMINIAYCSLGKDETRRYLSLQYINQLKLNNIIYQEKNEKYFPKNFKEEAFKDISYEDRKEGLMRKLEGLGIKDIFDKNGKPIATSLEERIKQINSKKIMHSYLTFYRVVSSRIHSSPEILDRYIITDENGVIKELYWGPKAENCNISPIFTSLYFMIINMEYISNYFGVPKKEDIDQFWEKIKKLGDKFNYPFEKIK